MDRQLLRLLPRVPLVVAAYAAMFALFWQFPGWRLMAIIPGTLLSLLLILIRKNQIVAVLFVAVTTLCGLAAAECYPRIDEANDPSPEILRDVLGSAIGGLLGMMYFEMRRA